MEPATENFAILATILCGILSIALYHVRRLSLYKAAARYTGPPALPIIGNALYFAGNGDELLNKFIASSKLYPTPIRFWLGNHLLIYVNNAEYLKVLTSSSNTLEKMFYYKLFLPGLGTGLLTAPVSKWSVHRKLLAPTFNQSVLKSFVEIFTRKSKTLVQRMEIELDRQEFEALPYIFACTLDFICESALGMNINVQTEHSPYTEAFQRSTEILCNRVLNVLLQPDIIFNCTPSAKIIREDIELLKNIASDLIQKKKQQLAEESAKSDTIIDDPPRRKPFLELLLGLSKNDSQLSNTEILDEVNTIILAGSDTTASTMSFTLLMLASHPEIQEKVYEELFDICGQEDDDRDIVYEDLNRMKYLECVIKESLRLFPPGPVIGRYVTEDLVIGEHTFPKGSSVLIGIMDIHRREEYWPNPLKFDPDRFLPEQTAKRKPYCYVPFSAGPRDCIGLRYAMVSMKVLLATVLRRYIVKKDIIVPVEEVGLKYNITIKPVEPIKIRIHRRTPKMNQA